MNLAIPTYLLSRNYPVYLLTGHRAPRAVGETPNPPPQLDWCVGNRTASFMDVGIDVTGGILAQFTSALFQCYRRKK